MDENHTFAYDGYMFSASVTSGLQTSHCTQDHPFGSITAFSEIATLDGEMADFLSKLYDFTDK